MRRGAALSSFPAVEVAPLSGGYSLQLFEHPGEMGGIGIAHPLGHLADTQSRVLHEFLGLTHPHGVEQVVKGLAQVAVEQLGQVPLRISLR